jgi:apolipoprotein N-acyltransferase
MHADTLYVRFGDWFAWLAVIGLLWSLMQLARRRAA